MELNNEKFLHHQKKCGFSKSTSVKPVPLYLCTSGKREGHPNLSPENWTLPDQFSSDHEKDGVGHRLLSRDGDGLRRDALRCRRRLQQRRRLRLRLRLPGVGQRNHDAQEGGTFHDWLVARPAKSGAERYADGLGATQG